MPLSVNAPPTCTRRISAYATEVPRGGELDTVALFKLFAADTPNTWKVAALLEELQVTAGICRMWEQAHTPSHPWRPFS